MSMGYEACGKDLDDLLNQLDKEANLSAKAKELKKKVREHIKNPKKP